MNKRIDANNKRAYSLSMTSANIARKAHTIARKATIARDMLSHKAKAHNRLYSGLNTEIALALSTDNRLHSAIKRLSK
jgi:inosine-uridine nucleoside N-ribohydrolase